MARTGEHEPGGGAARAAMLLAQLRVLGASTLAVVAVLVIDDPASADRPSALIGILVLPGLTVAVALVPWDRLPRSAGMVVPLADVVVLAVLRSAYPDAGFGVLVVLPVVWLATSFGRLGALVGAGFASTVLVVQTLLAALLPIGADAGRPHPAATVALVAAVVTVAHLADLADGHLRAHQTLLRRQTRSAESALDRADVERSTLRDVVNGVSFVVVAFDAQGRVTDTNQAARRLVRDLGLSLDLPFDRLPAYAADATTPLRDETWPHRRALAGETVDGELVWVGHADGRRAAVLVACTLQRRSDGEPARVVLIGREVTAEVEDARARDDVLASISHEFRTPLSSIVGYLDLALENPEKSDDVARHLEVALRNTERLVSLVEDLVAARSRKADEDIVLHLSEVDLVAEVEESVRSILPLARHRIVAIETRIPRDADGTRGTVVVRGDAFRLRQVVDNLVSNAVKYNRVGGTLTIGLTEAGPDDDHVVLTVGDTGEGITEADRRRIFEPFFRTGSARRSTTVGTGLGLAICAEIVRLHDGRIDVESEVGVGTTMVVRLPVGRPSARRTAAAVGAGSDGVGSAGAVAS